MDGEFLRSGGITSQRRRYDEACKDFEITKLVRQAQKEDLARRIKEALKGGKGPKSVTAGFTLPDEGEDPTLTRYIVNDSAVEKLGGATQSESQGISAFP